MTPEEVRALRRRGDALRRQRDSLFAEPPPLELPNPAAAPRALDEAEEWCAKLGRLALRAPAIRRCGAWSKLALHMPTTDCRVLLCLMATAPTLFGDEDGHAFMQHYVGLPMPERQREDSVRTFTIRLAADFVLTRAGKPMREQVAAVVSAALGEDVAADTVRKATAKKRHY